MHSFSLSSRPLHISLFLAFAAACTLPAQEAAAPALSLREALARVEQRNPSLAAYAYHERAAEGLIEQAGQRPNPTLDFAAENFAGTGARQGVRQLEATA